MRKEYTLLLYTGIISLIIFLSWLFRDYTIALPVPLPFGALFLIMLVVSNLIYEWMRGISPQVLTNIKHWSINTTKDMKRVPWHTDLINEEDMKNKSLGDLMIMFPGGVESWGLSVKSTSDYPCLIFPAIYTEREGDSYKVNANLMKYDYNELPMYVRYVLKNFGRRINEKNTPIYYAVTSHLDGSATPENLKVVLKARSDNVQFNELEEKLKTLHKELRRNDERKQRIIFADKKGESEE